MKNDFHPAKSHGFMGFTDLTREAKQHSLDRYVAEHKLDGSRYLLHLTAQGHHLTSRRESVVTHKPVDKIKQAYRLEALTLPKKWKRVILDGELMAPGGDHAALVSMVGSLPPRARQLQEQHGPLVLKVFDLLLLDADGEEFDLRPFPFHDRRHWLTESVLPWLYQANPTAPEVVQAIEQLVVPAERAKQLPFLKREFLRSLDLGYEGLMIKAWDATYGRGVWKWKMYRDAVAVVTGYEDEAQGKFAGWIKSVKFSVYGANGKLVEMGQASGMTDEERADITKHKAKYLGRIIEVEGQELDVNDRVRHPTFVRFRDDIDHRECTEKKFRADMTRKEVV